MGTTFSTTDIRGRTDDALTTEYVWNVGKAFAEWLTEEGEVIVASPVGANEATVHALIEGLLLQGRTVVMSTQEDIQPVIESRRAAGGVVVTHDGLQNIEIISLHDARGTVITADNGLMEIDQLVEAGNFTPAAIRGILVSDSPE